MRWRGQAWTGKRLVEVGKAVDTVKKGDKVVLPFNIGCGFCANCEQGLTGFCLTCADPSVMPGMAGAAYGFAGMGPYAGGQAQFLRVPYADFNCLHLPEDADEKENDYVMLSDIFPTGWHSTRLAALKPGESILIFGAGPVGLMAAMSARIQGASQIIRCRRPSGPPRPGEKDRCYSNRHKGWRRGRPDSRTHEWSRSRLRSRVYRLSMS